MCCRGQVAHCVQLQPTAWALCLVLISRRCGSCRQAGSIGVISFVQSPGLTLKPGVKCAASRMTLHMSLACSMHPISTRYCALCGVAARTLQRATKQHQVLEVVGCTASQQLRVDKLPCCCLLRHPAAALAPKCG